MTGAPYNSVTTPAVNAATTTNSGMPRAKDPPALAQILVRLLLRQKREAYALGVPPPQQVNNQQVK